MVLARHRDRRFITSSARAKPWSHSVIASSALAATAGSMTTPYCDQCWRSAVDSRDRCSSSMPPCRRKLARRRGCRSCDAVEHEHVSEFSPRTAATLEIERDLHRRAQVVAIEPV
jgi:hypothetical protein